MSKYFGTDGFRGEANKDLTFEHAIKVGRFIGWYYGAKENKKAKILLGKDTRRSGYMFENALCAGLIASGADVYVMHVTTTPSVAYITSTNDFDCGIMISASHNPYYDNGIKLFNKDGEKMDEETIIEVEKYIDDEMQLPLAERENIGSVINYEKGKEDYINYLISLIDYKFDGVKVGLDLSNGAAYNIGKEVFTRLNAEVYVMNDKPDGFNINTDCGSTHIEHLQKFVTDNNLDVGFAYDGDADRCICVDEKGNEITGDHVLYICGLYLKEKNELDKNKVVTTVMSNFGLYKAFDKVAIEYEKTKVGDKYVYENMIENGYCIGGEQSGHVIFSRHATTGDGILTSLKVMEVMLAKRETLSKLAAPVEFYPQVLKNVRVKNKADAQNDPDVMFAVEKVSQELGNEGRILVRESGTEPVIRVMVEANTNEICEKYVDEVIKVITEKGHTQ